MTTSATPAASSPSIEPLTASKAWKRLQAHYEQVRDIQLRELFAADPKRGERLTVEAAGLFFDYSKNRITDETVDLLIDLAQESGLKSQIEAMFRGDKINFTEGRAVLHVALRAPKGATICCRRTERCAGGPCGVGQDDRISPIAFAAASGRAIRASAFAM